MKYSASCLAPFKRTARWFWRFLRSPIGGYEMLGWILIIAILLWVLDTAPVNRLNPISKLLTTVRVECQLQSVRAAGVST